MPFNSYVTLDGNKYAALQQAWIPVITNPVTARVTLAADLDTTWGTDEVYEFQGELRCDVTPASGYGSPATLRTSLKKKQQLVFIDHYGVSYTIAVLGFSERSHSPNWEGVGNAMFFSVEIFGVLT
jgi:hypothetical protein